MCKRCLILRKPISAIAFLFSRAVIFIFESSYFYFREQLFLFSRAAIFIFGIFTKQTFGRGPCLILCTTTITGLIAEGMALFHKGHRTRSLFLVNFGFTVIYIFESIILFLFSRAVIYFLEHLFIFSRTFYLYFPEPLIYFFVNKKKVNELSLFLYRKDAVMEVNPGEAEGEGVEGIYTPTCWLGGWSIGSW